MYYLIPAVLFLLCYFLYWVKAMYNPFKSILIVGKKGGGKSTDITKRCIENHNKTFSYYDKDEKNFFKRFKKAKWNMVSNCKVNLPFPVQKVNIKMIGDFIPKPFSYILLDEINLVWDNRKFKEFKESTQEFFRLARKLRCKVVMYSQTFDCDKKIRDLVDEMWLYQNKLGVFTYGKRISKIPDIRENGMNAESQLVDVIKFDSIFIPHSRRVTWIPKYIKYFDSYENLNNKPYIPEEYWPVVKKERRGFARLFLKKPKKEREDPSANGKLGQRELLDNSIIPGQYGESTRLAGKVN